MFEPDQLLMAYADDELTAADAQAVEMQISTDTSTCNAVAMFRGTAALLRSARSEATYRTSTDANLPNPALSLHRWPNGWGAGSVECVVPSRLRRRGAMARRRWASCDALAEIADYHKVFSRETTHLVELSAERPDELADWIGARPQNLPRPNLEKFGLHLAGGRLLLVDGERVAELIYTRDGGLPTGLCILRIKHKYPRVSITHVENQHLVSWQDDNFSCVLVGELDDAAEREPAGRIEVLAGS